MRAEKASRGRPSARWIRCDHHPPPRLGQLGHGHPEQDHHQDRAQADQGRERPPRYPRSPRTSDRPGTTVHWLYHDAGRFFPSSGSGTGRAAGRRRPGRRLRPAAQRPSRPDVRARAARNWCDWEDAVNSLEEGWTPSERYADSCFAMTFARLMPSNKLAVQSRSIWRATVSSGDASESTGRADERSCSAALERRVVYAA